MKLFSLIISFFILPCIIGQSIDTQLKEISHRYSILIGDCLNAFNDSYLNGDSIFANLSECTKNCNEMSSCLSFTWNQSGICQLRYEKCVYADIEINSNDTYYMEKLQSTAPNVQFGSTYYSKWFGDCTPGADVLLTKTAQNVEDCAKECEYLPRCKSFSFDTQVHQHNCVVRKGFCSNDTDRTYRGNQQFHLYQRISFEPHDIYVGIIFIEYHGICSNVSLIYQNPVDNHFDCAYNCASYEGCVAAVFSASKQGIGQTNCAFMTEMCNPLNLVKTEDIQMRTFQIISNFSGFKRLILGNTEYLTTHGYTGALLDVFNVSTENQCSIQCAKTLKCVAFTYHNRVNIDNCVIHESWILGKSLIPSSFYIRLSFPTYVSGQRAVQYHYDCGHNLEYILVENKTVCARLCEKLPSCTAFLFTQKPLDFGDGSVNCIPKRNLCQLNDTVIRLLMDGWNMYQYSNEPASNYFLATGNNEPTVITKELSDCAGLCDDKPSCKAITSDCHIIRCSQSHPNCYQSQLAATEDVYVKNNTGATMIRWAGRDFLHWNANCPDDNIAVLQAASLELCMQECNWRPNCWSLVFSEVSTPNCFVKSRLCKPNERNKVGDPHWHLYNQSTFVYDVWAGHVFRDYNGDCEDAEALGMSYTNDREICAQQCVNNSLCGAFALSTTDFGPICVLRQHSCPAEQQIYIGEHSHFSFELIRQNYTGVQLDTLIEANAADRPLEFYATTQEKCFVKCLQNPNCFGLSHFRKSYATSPDCRLFTSLSTIKPTVNNHHPACLSWIDPSQTVGYVATEGKCDKLVANPFWLEPTDCATKCAETTKCRSFVVVNGTRCYISGQYCSKPMLQESTSVSYNKMVFKDSSLRVFHGVKFVRLGTVCNPTLIGTTTSESDCSLECVKIPSCSVFMWLNQSVDNCYIQRHFCPPNGSELTDQRRIYQRLSKYVAASTKDAVSTSTKKVLLLTTEKAVETVESTKSQILLSNVTVAIVLVAMLLICLLVFVIWRKQSRVKQLKQLQVSLTETKEIDPILPIFDQIDNLPFDSSFELQLDHICVDRKNLKTLGSGQFGRVVLGNYIQPSGVKITVAIKRTKSSWDSAQYRMLFKEICLMVNLGKHPNLVNMVGAVTQISRGHLYMVLEYCENGSLRDFILKSVEQNGFEDEIIRDAKTAETYKRQEFGQRQIGTNDNQLSTTNLLSFAYQIASGMEYVASVKFIHRDLAARNVLLTSNLITKISDFGLGLQDYSYYEKNKSVLLPIRWLAPEAILRHKFSIQSDVWSFGLTLGEIFSLGCVPFSHVSIIDEKFAKDLLSGKTAPESPSFAPNAVYDVIKMCCHGDAQLRCSFAQCKDMLSAELQGCNPEYFAKLCNDLSLSVDNSYAKPLVKSKYLPSNNLLKLPVDDTTSFL